MNTGKLFVFWSLFLLSLIRPVHGADPLDLWEPVTVPGPGALNSVAHGNGVFVAVGGEGRMLHSGDGLNWTNTSLVATGVWNRVRFINSEFVAVGSTGWMFSPVIRRISSNA